MSAATRSFPPVDEQFERITRGAVDRITDDELRRKLELSHRSGEPLVVKVGFDPTAPDIHLGHVVGLPLASSQGHGGAVDHLHVPFHWS